MARKADDNGKYLGAKADPDERLYLQSVARAFAVIESFSGSHRPKTLNEIKNDLGINKSAAQRTIYTLVQHGYLEKSDGVGYRLGIRILDAAFNFLRLHPLVERAAPILAELRRTADERVDLSLFDRESMIYALRYQSKRETFFANLPGRRQPTFMSSGGRACLAKLDDKVVQEILEGSERTPATPRTITDIEGVWEKIREARRDTYAYAVEEVLMGEVVVSAAVTDRNMRPIGAVHIAGLLSDWSVEEFRRRFAPLTLETARELSA